MAAGDRTCNWQEWLGGLALCVFVLVLSASVLPPSFLMKSLLRDMQIPLSPVYNPSCSSSWDICLTLLSVFVASLSSPIPRMPPWTPAVQSCLFLFFLFRLCLLPTVFLRPSFLDAQQSLPEVFIPATPRHRDPKLQLIFDLYNLCSGCLVLSQLSVRTQACPRSKHGHRSSRSKTQHIEQVHPISTWLVWANLPLLICVYQLRLLF